jgi:hypothetical protein
MVPATLDAMVDQFVRLRDKIAEATKAHEEKIAPAKEYKEQLEAAILEKLNETGLESAKTKFGTAYKTIKKSATVADGAAFRAWVVDEGQYDVVDWRANAVAVSKYLDEHEGALPPGINYGTFVAVGVRRA